MKTYAETIDYIYSKLPMFQRVGAEAFRPSLNNIKDICKHLNHPEKKFKSIHIAGTNGKGSTAHFLAAIFQVAGYKTGLHTSPHYLDFRERIKINGAMIPEKAVIEFIEKNKAKIEAINPSFFELSTALAFDYFAQENVDIAVIETGMGGRFDSTNIIRPELSVITNIDLDHTDFLGNTLEKIAQEKAGIIKPNIPVVIGETQEETKAVFRKYAEKNRSNIYFADQNFQVKNHQHKERELHLEVEKNNGETIEIESGLTGDYQLKNIPTVLQAIEILKKQGYKIPNESLKKGIKEVVTLTKMLGRWQILGKKPLTIGDSAHNEAGIKKVIEQLKATPHKNLHIVFGVVKDKDIEAILKLLPKDANYYFCRSSIPRALPENELKEKATKHGLKGEVYSSVTEAWEAAQKKAKSDDLIFIGGSIFTLADALSKNKK